MLDVRLLSDRLFATATGTLFLTTIAFLGSLYAFALLQQDGLGRSALVSGALTSTEALGVIGLSQLVRRAYPRVGPRRLGMAGAVAMAVICLGLATIDEGTPIWLVAVGMLLLGSSVSALTIPLQTAAFARVAHRDTGHASSLFNGARQVSGALGVALLATVITAAGATGVPTRAGTVADLTPYHAAFFVAAGLALCAAGVCSCIRDADAAATMRPTPPRRRPRGSWRRRTSRAGAGPSPAPPGGWSADAPASAPRDAADR
jgi:MFS family permease